MASRRLQESLPHCVPLEALVYLQPGCAPSLLPVLSCPSAGSLTAGHGSSAWAGGQEQLCCSENAATQEVTKAAGPLPGGKHLPEQRE